MGADFESAALMRYLKRYEIYSGKVLELREAIRGWLEYVPHSFPHYTRHTIGHSEAIVLQISKLLFPNDEVDRPVIKLSGVEAYILVASAYLHDAGMVASDKEKQEILAEDEWNRWIGSEGSAHARWQEIQNFRNGDSPADEAVRHFVADLGTRFLIAEYVRRVHHERAADVITQHQSALGRFAFDDHDLRTAISDVCVAHGMPRERLDDKIRFPLLRQIRNEDVNLRLLAIVFRLGDLLDLQNDRACPLLINAACPIPAESFAHWTQYQRIKHRAVSPNRIEIRAECEVVEEYRVLRDWCQWIVDEVRTTPNLLAGSTRHADWSPPKATMTGDDPTILVDPTPNATYRAKDWRFELDKTAIFDRLISDVYSEKMVFIRELIQNALDAMRCQMYEHLVKTGLETPASPTKVPCTHRDKYRLKISIRDAEVLNQNTNANEPRQIVTVEDCGIGMDEEIILSHFLQIGRSYYTTESFRRRYAFTPTSQFGIGFLSVFAVSDHVLVETFKPSSEDKSGPVRLKLTGPRNQLAVENGSRKIAGTVIVVRLKPDIRLEKGELTELVANWCKLVEFPIEVNDYGDISVIVAENPKEAQFDVPDMDSPGAKFSLRDFAIDSDGIEGHIFVLVHTAKNGTESWDRAHWYTGGYPRKHPEVTIKHLPENLICHHGIAARGLVPYFGGTTEQNYRFLLDIRRRDYRPTLSRSEHERMFLEGSLRNPRHDPILMPTVKELETQLDTHIHRFPRAKSDDNWKYSQRLIDAFSITYDYWEKCPKTIKVWTKSGAKELSLSELNLIPLITEILDSRRHTGLGGDSYNFRILKARKPRLNDIEHAILETDFHALSDEFKRSLFKGRVPRNARWLDSFHLAIDWCVAESSQGLVRHGRSYFPCDLPDCGVVALRFHRSYPGGDFILLNSSNSGGRWLINDISEYIKRKGSAFGSKCEILIDLLSDALQLFSEHLQEFDEYVSAWRKIPDLPKNLIPPFESTSADMMRMPSPYYQRRNRDAERKIMELDKRLRQHRKPTRKRQTRRGIHKSTKRKRRS